MKASKTVKAKRSKKVSKKTASNALVFNYLTIENAYTFYGENTIPLTSTGLTLVTGKNLDTREPSNNGAGKTRIWDCFRRLLYGRKALDGESPLEAYDKERGNFRIETGFTKGGHTYVFREVRNHKEFGTGLTLLRDGKPYGPVNDPEALRKRLQEIINRTYEEFVGTVIWRQNHDHVLIEGKPNERIKWISDFFGLSRYDELHIRFKEYLKNTKESLVELADVRAQFKATKDRLEQLGDVTDAKVQRKKLQHRLETLQEKVRVAEKSLRKLQSKITQLQQLERSEASIRESPYKNKTASELKDMSKAVQARISTNTAMLTSYKRRHALTEQLETAETKCSEYARLLKKAAIDLQLPGKTKPAKLKRCIESRLSELQSHITRCSVQLANEDALKLLQRARKELEASGFKPDKISRSEINAERDQLNESLESVVDTIALAKQVLGRKDLMASGKRECPECGQVVDQRHLRHAIEQASAKLEKADKRKSKLLHRREQITSALEALRALETQRAKLGKEFDEHVELDANKIRDKIARYRDEVRRLTDSLQTIERYHERRQYASEKKSEITTLLSEEENAGAHLLGVETSTTDLQATIKQLEVEYMNLTELAATQKNIEAILHEMKFDNTTTLELAKAKRQLNDTEDELGELAESKSRIRDKLEELGAGLSSYDKLYSQYKELLPKMKHIKRLERRERIYKLLVQAYSPSGLKVTRLRQLLDEIRERLPAWTSILFTEKNFKIDVTGNEKKIGFEITQTRTVQKKGSAKPTKYVKKYDARYASGSERTRISMCLLLTLGDVASDSKSCNLQVLDELERGVDIQSKRILSEEIIPLMRHMKPSLYLITHSLDVPPDQCDSKLVVTKQNQQTTTAFTYLHKPNKDPKHTSQKEEAA